MDLDFISKRLGVSEQFLRDKVEEKLNELNHLIDEETALLLVLKDLGIDPNDILKIKLRDIVPDSIVDELEVIVCEKLRETTNNYIYKICDESGYARLVISKNVADKIKIKQGLKIKLRKPYVIRGSPIVILVKNIVNIEILGESNIPEDPKPINVFFAKILIGRNNYMLTENLVFKKLSINTNTEKTSLLREIGKEIIKIRELEYSDILKLYKDLY